MRLAISTLPCRLPFCVKTYFCCCAFALSAPVLSVSAFDLWNAGFFYDQFPLTLEAGRRTEVLGPFFYQQNCESDDSVAVPPLFSYTEYPTEAVEFDVLYPLLTYDRFGGEYRWQLMQLLSFSGGQDQEEVPRKRFTVFPFYFQQRSPDTNLNYTAVFPFYGHLKQRIFRSEIDFVLWPIYVKTVRRKSVSALPDDPFVAVPYRYFQAMRGDITTYNYLYPFFHLRYGNGLKGWQFWPLYGRERKEVTTSTNVWGDLETTPGHDKTFVFWPFFADQKREVGTSNELRQQFLLPFYSFLRSPGRDSTSYLWPLGLTLTDDRDRRYHEVDAPWPFIVFARGEGKTTSRVWPIFSRASNTNLESNTYLWPLYKYNRLQSAPLDRERTRIIWFLYSVVNEKNTETGRARGRTDLWPLFAHRRDFDGSSRLQVLALLEPILPTNKSIQRNWSPLWSLWRSENNATNGAASQSLLWNLYRRDTTATTKKCSLLFGLFQYSSEPGRKRWRLFYVPLGRRPTQPDQQPE